GGNYVNSGIAQQLITPAGHQWVGVSAGADHTRDTGVNQAFGAGRGAAMVAAGFQSNVRGGATGLFSGHAQGVHFGVGFTGFLMPAFTDDLTLLADNNATDAGIGAGRPAPQFCQLQGAGHVKLVVHSLCPPDWREDDRRSISARDSSRSLKLRYTEAKRTSATSSSWRSSDITHSPSIRLGTSRSPLPRRRCFIRVRAASMSSTLTGRFSSARKMPAWSFSSLKGSRVPFCLMMRGITSSAVSK